MNRSVTVKAPCKLNLSLDITGRREDGYHFMKMVMQTVDLYDRVVLTSNLDGKIRVVCEDGQVPQEEENIAHKAAVEFFNETELECSGLDIYIDKKIPMQAGLGGGSADGAAVLVGLNELYQTGLSLHELGMIGQKVGADIPFCIHGGTALVEGIGEIITPLPDLPECYIVIAKPQMGSQTAAAFRRYDELKEQERLAKIPDLEEMVAAVVSNELEPIAHSMGNVLESVLDLEEVKHIEAAMLEQGALGAMMTGSGSAVFGIFEGKSQAKRCQRILEEEGEFSFLTKPVNHGAKVEKQA